MQAPSFKGTRTRSTATKNGSGTTTGTVVEGETATETDTAPPALPIAVTPERLRVQNSAFRS